MKHKIPHDPFHDNEPQVPAHVLPPEPPELRPLDEAHGGINRKPNVLTDEGFDHAFKHEKEHTKEHNFFDRGKK